MKFLGANQTYGLHGDGTSGVAGYADMINDYLRLKVLYDNFTEELQNPAREYVNSNFETFIETYTTEDYYLPKSLLLNNDNTFFYGSEVTLKEDYSYDENLVDNWRDCTHRLINVLKQANTEYYKIQTLENENTELQSYKDILEDREKLIAYVEEIQTTSYLFTAQATYSKDLNIKPWYKRYLEIYGPPGDGVFDSTLLAEIIEDMYGNGEIDSVYLSDYISLASSTANIAADIASSTVEEAEEEADTTVEDAIDDAADAAAASNFF